RGVRQGSPEGMSALMHDLHYYPSIFFARCDLLTPLKRLKADCRELARSALWDMLQLVQASHARPLRRVAAPAGTSQSSRTWEFLRLRARRPAAANRG